MIRFSRSGRGAYPASHQSNQRKGHWSSHRGNIVIRARVFWSPVITPASAAELQLRKIAYHSQLELPIEYKGVQMARGYVIDLLVEDSLIVEIKSVDKLLPIHSAQLMTYMRRQRVSSDLLMNFNVAILPHGIHRILL